MFTLCLKHYIFFDLCALINSSIRDVKHILSRFVTWMLIRYLAARRTIVCAITARARCSHALSDDSVLFHGSSTWYHCCVSYLCQSYQHFNWNFITHSLFWSRHYYEIDRTWLVGAIDYDFIASFRMIEILWPANV